MSDCLFLISRSLSYSVSQYNVSLLSFIKLCGCVNLALTLSLNILL